MSAMPPTTRLPTEVAGGRSMLPVVLGCVMGASAFGVDSLLPALPELAAHFSITPTASQMAVTFSLIGFGIGQLPVGLLADRHGRRVTALVCLCAYILGGLAGAAAPSIEAVYGARLIQGMGAAGLGVAARAIVRDVASGDRAGRIMSGAISFMGIVTIAAPIVGGTLVTLGSWRTVMLGIAAYGLMALGLALLFFPSYQRQKSPRTAMQQLKASFHAFLASPRSLFATVLFTVLFSGIFVFVTTGSTLAFEFYGLSQGVTGWMVALIAASYMTGAATNHQLVERWGLYRMLALSVGLIALAGIGLLALSFWADVPMPVLWSMIMLYGVGFGIAMPTLTAIVMDPLPEFAAFATSIVGTVQSIGAAAVSGTAAALYTGTPRSLCLLMGVAGLLGLTIHWLGKGTLTRPQPH